MDKIKERLAFVRNDKDYLKIYKENLNKIWGMVYGFISKVFGAILEFVSGMFSENNIRENKWWMILALTLMIIAIFLTVDTLGDKQFAKIFEGFRLELLDDLSNIKSNQEIMEEAYMQGQIDALKNKIRIKVERDYWVYKITPLDDAENKVITPNTRIAVE